MELASYSGYSDAVEDAAIVAQLVGKVIGKFPIGEPDMRTFIAFLLGIAVTIGAAYVHDNAIAGTAAKPLVNWDQVGGVTRDAVEAARNQWNRLTSR